MKLSPDLLLLGLSGKLDLLEYLGYSKCVCFYLSSYRQVYNLELTIETNSQKRYEHILIEQVHNLHVGIKSSVMMAINLLLILSFCK